MLRQEYSLYTTEDFEVWEILFTRQTANLAQNGSRPFRDALTRSGFTAGKIPDFTEVNRYLGTATGWQLQAVPNIVPVKEFFEMLREKIFPATTWLRKKAQLDYLEEPDMFHDVFGHVPMLGNADFCGYLTSLSQIAAPYADQPEALELLSRIYWFTVEFGMLQENGAPKVFGAGLASSYGETLFSVSREPKHIPFSVKEVLETNYRNNAMQNRYFVLDSLAQLYASVPETERLLPVILESETTIDVGDGMMG